MVLSFAATNIQLGILDHSLGGPLPSSMHLD
jgi:hypothetical protein